MTNVHSLEYEQARIRALKNMNILDTEQDQELDAITLEAQHYFNSKACLISLIAEDRQWFKSRQGIEGPEPPKSVSFCTYAIAEEEYLVVPDATLDERFCNNPLVTGPPFIRAYAGSILHTGQGYEVGTFCIIFDQPREFTKEDIAVLQRFGAAAEKLLFNGYHTAL
ncbi:GAF domain-containing protein [Flavobacterium sp. W21_SRS_FM6]|uniref:GAF domain-containing protein n=1 Tax=Flavobacterium sp. W21_SRS_FM6 TaxID=3240268 RepID=UPI003F90914E